MDPVPARCDGDGLLHRAAHPQAIDVGHRDRPQAGGLDVLLLSGVDAADRDEHRGPGVDRSAQGRRERIVGEAERDRERHPVHVAGRRGARRVAVGVRVHPDDARATPGARDARERADGHGVVAAEHQRDRAGAFDVGDDRRELLGDPDDLVHVVRGSRAHRRELALVHAAVFLLCHIFVPVRDGNVPAIPDGVAERGDAGA